MIEVDGLNKYFGPNHVVKDVSFKVEQGEILGFLGLNGAGKTTTMRIITGYFPATSGTARVAGHDVFSDSLAVRRQTGYLPENVPLYTDMVVSEYLRFVAEIKSVPREQLRSQLGDIIDRIGLNEVQRRIIGKLSKGYRQRVGLAQALIGNPQVLVLDEPTVGLDPAQIREIRSLIKSMAGERTVILSTHILPEVAMTCSRVLVIHRGEIVADRSLEDLSRTAIEGGMLVSARGTAEQIEQCLIKIPETTEVVAQPSHNPDEPLFLVHSSPGVDSRSRIAEAVIGAGFGLLELRPATTNLEDIFVRLIGEREA